jgi:hypothetical protein
MVKLDVDTLATVPTDPPAAGPDRALDAPPALGPAAAPGAGCAAEAEGDVASPTESPIIGTITAAAMSRRAFVFLSNRRPLGRGVWSFSFMMALLVLVSLRRECQPFL